MIITFMKGVLVFVFLHARSSYRVIVFLERKQIPRIVINLYLEIKNYSGLLCYTV